MVMDIDDDGALMVLDDRGDKKRIISGDVSIRGVEGYV
jgi:BirA family biotin operon repressor/biotin-[acetyl-CoA-carboxylase] ligase